MRPPRNAATGVRKLYEKYCTKPFLRSHNGQVHFLILCFQTTQMTSWIILAPRAAVFPWSYGGEDLVHVETDHALSQHVDALLDFI